MKINFVGSIWDNCTYEEEPPSPYNKTLPAGSAKWAITNDSKEASLLFTCPCGCGKIGAIVIGSETEHGWKWNGDRVNPTFTPSVLQVKGCGWHGYLTNGEWISV